MAAKKEIKSSKVLKFSDPGKPTADKHHPAPRVPVTITLDPELLDEGREAARQDNRNFSNYIETLILRDVALAQMLTAEITQN